MKYETLYIMVRVTVHADHQHLSDLVSELESEAKLSLSDTANINVLETEILMSRVRNSNVHKIKSYETV